MCESSDLIQIVSSSDAPFYSDQSLSVLLKLSAFEYFYISRKSCCALFASYSHIDVLWQIYIMALEVLYEGRRLLCAII